VPDLFRLQLLLATFAGWINRHQAQAIDYLVEEELESEDVWHVTSFIDAIGLGP
jgi:hypothetical protein